MKRLLLMTSVIFMAATIWAKSPIKHLEPMNWYVGMQNKSLQLMVHGENIASYTPKINYTGVTIEQTILVENSNYLFINLKIAENTNPGTFPIEFFKGKKVAFNHNYTLLARNKKENIHAGFDASDVMYLLMPDRFSNGDPSNDSTDDTSEKHDRTNPNGRHGGDLQGVINHLDYFSNLGTTTLWLNPFMENDQPAYSYHGYAISDFYKVDSRHGSNELFVELVDKAHEKELKVIMDMIFNHSGAGHWWMQDLPTNDWIHQHEAFMRSNFRAPVITDPYASKADTEQMLTGWFDVNMPDLNQNNPLLATYFIQNTIWWIEFSGIDGIRVDTQPYPYKEFMAKWAKAVMAEYPNFNIVGEAWLQKISIAAYFQKNAKNTDGYNSYMPAITDFPTYNALSAAFNEDEGWSEGMARLYYLLAQDFLYADPMNLLVFPDNHDLNRYYENMEKDLRKYKMGLAYILVTRGIPQIYYGTEILMEGKEHEGHGQIRKDFPGGWVNDTINAFNASGRNNEQNEAFDYLQNLLQWRKTNNAIHKGKLIHFLPEDGIYVMFRYTDDEAVMLILNNNNTDSKELNTTRFNEILKKYSNGKNIINGNTLESMDIITIDAKSALIIELSK